MYKWLAWKLPKKLVYWACIRVFAHATTGKYSHQNVVALTFSEALGRWRSSVFDKNDVPYL